MADKLQINFPIDDWNYLVTGAITDENTVCTTTLSACNPECPFIHDACDSLKCPSIECPYKNKQMDRVLLDEYEDKMVSALKAAAIELGIDIKLDGAGER